MSSQNAIQSGQADKPRNALVVVNTLLPTLRYLHRADRAAPGLAPQPRALARSEWRGARGEGRVAKGEGRAVDTTQHADVLQNVKVT